MLYCNSFVTCPLCCLRLGLWDEPNKSMNLRDKWWNISIFLWILSTDNWASYGVRCHNAVSFPLLWAHYGALLGVDVLLMSITSVAGLLVLTQYSSMWPRMKRKLDITTTINTCSTAFIIMCLLKAMALSWGGELDWIRCLFFCASFLPSVHISLDTPHARGVLFWLCDVIFNRAKYTNYPYNVVYVYVLLN